MSMSVTPLRAEGRRIPREDRRSQLGDLVVVHKPDHDGTMRRQAQLWRTDKRGGLKTQLLGPLYDPFVTAADAEGILLRGLQPVAGAEVAQEWWVTFQL